MTAEALRDRRRRRGLSQRDLAQLSGVPQPNIAAYETGRRRPDESTLARLRSALETPTLDMVRAHRAELLRLAERRRLSNVRIFGSVARGEQRPGSDVDLLVTPFPEASLFDLAGFQEEAGELLGVRVDVLSDGGTGTVLARIRAEAVPL